MAGLKSGLAVLLLWAAAGAALGSAAWLPPASPRPAQSAGFDRPAWMSPATTLFASEALECYRREAELNGKAYCASSAQSVIEVVWASCFGQERSLLIAAAADADDGAAIEYLASLEAHASRELLSSIEMARSASPACSPD